MRIILKIISIGIGQVSISIFLLNFFSLVFILLVSQACRPISRSMILSNFRYRLTTLTLVRTDDADIHKLSEPKHRSAFPSDRPPPVRGWGSQNSDHPPGNGRPDHRRHVRRFHRHQRHHSRPDLLLLGIGHVSGVSEVVLGDYAGQGQSDSSQKGQVMLARRYRHDGANKRRRHDGRLSRAEILCRVVVYGAIWAVPQLMSLLLSDNLWPLS